MNIGRVRVELAKAIGMPLQLPDRGIANILAVILQAGNKQNQRFCCICVNRNPERMSLTGPIILIVDDSDEQFYPITILSIWLKYWLDTNCY